MAAIFFSAGATLDLVRPQQGLQHQHAVTDSERGQPGLLPERKADDGQPVGVLERLQQQLIGLGRLTRRLQVVGLLEHQRIDLVDGHEVLYRDFPVLLDRQAGEVVGGQHDGLPVLALVRLLDVGERHHLAVQLAHPLVTDPAAVLAVHLPELHVPVLGCAVQPHRHVHQAERNGTLPDRSHATMMDAPAALCRKRSPPDPRRRGV